MNKSPTRKSIFNILLFRIFIVIILFNLILTGLNIHESLLLQKKTEELRLQRIETTLKNELNSLDRNLNSANQIFYYEASILSRKFVDLGFFIDLKEVNLERQLNLFGIDSDYYDIYIIENGIIVNTTFQSDLGLNLYRLSDTHRKYLQGLIEKGIFQIEKVSIESSTKRFKSYSYQPTQDKKYIVEIGAYSKIVDEIMDGLRDGIEGIINENNDIQSINIWISRDTDFRSAFALLSPEDINVDTSLIRKAGQENRNIKTTFTRNNHTFSADYLFQEGTDQQNLNNISNKKVISVITDITDLNVPIKKIIKRQFFILSCFLITVFLILIFITREFKQILNDLMQKTSLISKGALNVRAVVKGNHEFTTLAEQFNQMVENIELTNKTLQKQQDKIGNINTEITSSLTYAQRIQLSILPRKGLLDSCLHEYFIIYKPRGIVSGDFYWVTNIENVTIIAAVDCTGHGVPGALMSILGTAFLNEIVNKEYITHPAVILRRLRKDVIHSLQQKGDRGEQKEGMDIALCSIDYINMKLQFAGANNPLYMVRDSKKTRLKYAAAVSSDEYTLYEVKGDRMPIGISDVMDKFTLHEIDLLKGDVLYMFSDGFADQFGGPSGKKLQYKNFRNLLINNCSKSMEEQKQIIDKTFEDWKGELSQVDDILVVGIRIN